jgi:hypothetical protein
MTVREAHEWWAWVVVVANGLAGAWALAAHWVPVLRHRSLWWFTTAAQLAIFVQVILGVVMVGAQGIEVDEFHMFYGFVSIIAVGIVYSYRQQMAPQRFLLYGGGGLFLMGLSIRAMFLA